MGSLFAYLAEKEFNLKLSQRRILIGGLANLILLRSSFRMDIIKELFQFVWIKKKIVLFPILIIMILMAILLVFSKGSALAPLIYTLF